MKGLAVDSEAFKELQRWVYNDYSRTKVIDKAPARALALIPGILVQDTDMKCLLGGTKNRELTIEMLVNRKGLESLGDIFAQFDTAASDAECLSGHTRWHSSLSFNHQRYGNRRNLYTPHPCVSLVLMGYVDGKEANINMLLGIIANVSEKLAGKKKVNTEVTASGH